ncbi:TonB family protein [uncultured Paludibaculum sp.]|uniref:cell envelope integrity protein TolA n=1 Tax=uncultured Paludibaculum sp. TaxID=1765020 RepID=UPI002AAC3B50|nr:TonB family protein [uncultured Paludibaculum sp.]
MDQHVDVLAERDSLRRPLVGSLMLHGALFGTIGLLTVFNIGKSTTWGDPNSMGGGSVSVTPVQRIPLPGRTGPKNPVAEDTQSEIPEEVKPKPKTKQAVKDDPDAIPMKSKKRQKADRTERASNRTAKREYYENQVYANTGQAASSPIFGMAPGSGQVGVGSNSPFGSHCGAYATLLRDRVGQRWRTDQVDARIHTLPPAIVTFDLARTGQVTRISLSQSSGNATLDYSAQRAITEAAPFQPIPPECEGNPAHIEFWFQLKR